MVIRVENGDPPTLTLRYAFDGDAFTKQVTESSTKTRGDQFLLYVNPQVPQQSIDHSFAAWFLGFAFVAFSVIWFAHFPSAP